MTLSRELLNLLVSSPVSLLPDVHASLIQMLRAENGEQKLIDRSAAATDFAVTDGAIAVIPLQGLILHRPTAVTRYYGIKTIQELIPIFDAAVANPGVKAIVFDVDSPGGVIDGVEEFAARILNARGTKPIIAVANTLMASAAYWIASACDEIIATPTAMVGSIGVWTMHMDYSEWYKQMGITPTLISAGKYKVEGHPYAPLTDEAREHLQGGVDNAYDAFVKAVARGRGVSPADVRKGYGEGRVLWATAAKEAGLVDRIATVSDVIGKLATRRGGRRVDVLRRELDLAASGLQ